MGNGGFAVASINAQPVWPAIGRAIAIYQYTPLETNFDEFSACPDAEAVFGGVIGVAVIVAPRDICL